jgi:hypothetical protein
MARSALAGGGHEAHDPADSPIEYHAKKLAPGVSKPITLRRQLCPPTASSEIAALPLMRLDRVELGLDVVFALGSGRCLIESQG